MWMCFLCESHPVKQNLMWFLMLGLMVLIQMNKIYESSRSQTLLVGTGFALIGLESILWAFNTGLLSVLMSYEYYHLY